ncbi:MAG: glycosyltransferase, partial [Gammaproteobacteria bacterium]|nr:glycosyltransferase [Gammaproteobacteria bacterium]
INRMVEFKNMSEVDTPPETTVVCAEVTQEHENVVERVIEDLVRAGMLTKDEVLDTTVVREPFSYPVYGSTYDHILEDAQQEFKRYANLSIVGRAAEFRHREVDDNLASAIQAVGEIVERLAPEVVQAEVEGEEAMPPTTEPLVYAVILTYNHYEDTDECLESVFASDYGNLRVVLVDNGSSDGTPEKVRQNFPETHVIENEQNLGVPAGYNVGFSYALQAGAQYILLLNNDTVVPPEMLPSLVSFARKDPQAGILMPKVLYYGSEDRVWSSGGHYRTFPPAILMT